MVAEDDEEVANLFAEGAAAPMLVKIDVGPAPQAQK